MNEEVVQYYVVNTELKMSPGKTAAQVAHAAIKLTVMANHDISLADGDDSDVFIQAWLSWYYGSMAKVVLGASQAQLETLGQLPHVVTIYDEGRTEIPSHSLTVVGFRPMVKSWFKPYVGDLKLYR